MKTIKLLFAFGLILLYFHPSAQTTIWSEDFTYEDETDTGQGTPAITTWTADGKFPNGTGIYVMDNRLQGKNTTFKSKEDWFIDEDDPIEIADYINVTVSLDLSAQNTGNGDYVEVQYSIDGGSWIDFPGSPFNANFGSLVPEVTGLSGNTLRLHIRMVNNSNNEYYYSDNVLVSGTLSTVDNPDDFSANAVSTTQIDLSFSPNPENDDVIIVWNTTGTFTVPSGIPPAAGQAFAGGTVLYQGTSSPVNHGSLIQNTQYFYKAWSYDGSSYSSGLTSDATTLCILISSFPWSEGFENGGIIPDCWSQEYVAGDDVDWQFLSGNGEGNPGVPHSGSYNACLKDNDTEDDKTMLITPALDLSAYSSATLTFWHAQLIWGNRQDELRVYYKNTQNGPWVLLYSYTAQVTSWTQQTIALSGLSGTYYIAFEGNAKRGYGVCIDDVSVGIPPVADFMADNTTPGLNEPVLFTDLSENAPDSWAWSFIPNTVNYLNGTSASSQNPQVEFLVAGAYTVSLAVSNSYGNDQETKTDYIHVGSSGLWTGATSTDWNTPTNWENHLVPVSAEDVTIPSSAINWPVKTGDLTLGADCNNLTMEEGAELTVIGTLTIGKALNTNNFTIIRVSGDWSNTGTFNAGNGTVIFNGTDESTIERISTFTGGGKVDFTGNGQYHPYSGYYNIFDCYSEFQLVSVLVRASTAKPRTFYWANSAGVIQQQITVDVPAGESRVELNFTVTPGTSHRLSVLDLSPELFRNNSNVSYPYPIGSVGAVTGSSYNLFTYYYCYDFEFIGAGTEAFYNLEIAKDNNVVITGCNLDVQNDLTVAPGAHLTNGAPFSMGVSGNAVFGSSETANASFIDYGTFTVAGDTRVELYLTNDVWHYISSPISEALSGVFFGAYLKPFIESIDDWGPYITSETVPLNVMQGYSAWVPDLPVTVDFQGNLNNGFQSIGVTCRDYNPLVENGGWNLVGNPYPSALDWDAAGWTKDQVDNTIYFYSGDGVSGNYIYYQGSGGELPGVGTSTASSVIPAMQGFLIHVMDDGVPGVVNGMLAVTNQARIHSDQAYYKSEEAIDVPLIRLECSDATGLQDEAIIRFYEAATPGHDGAYDAYKLEGYRVPQIFTRTTERDELAINTLPEYSSGDIIPLDFKSPVNGEYTLQMTVFENFESGTVLYLEDLQSGEMHELTGNGPYSFQSSPDDATGRFLLHFGKEGEHLKKLPSNGIYAYGKTVYIPLASDTPTRISVFNLMGQEVAQLVTSEKGISKIGLDCKPGYYIVRTRSNSATSAQKILIR